jgi:LytS/YehU family sensor histidine kinase
VREIELARAYLAIEQVRFPDRLRVTIDVEEAAAGALVPGLLLQPLVENAVHHGIARRPGPGSIELVARRDGDRLSLVVRDDGVGLGSGDGAPRQGIGLANVRARLQRLYGGAERLELFPRPEGGVEARVEIPLREAPAP